MKTFYAIAPVFFRLRGIQTAMLITVGSKTGQERAVQLSVFADGSDAWVVIASAAGAAKHPGWFFNMARNPDKIWLQFGGRKVRVNADTLQGPDRDTAWQRVVAKWPGYEGYRKKTDRDIPVIRLTAA